MLTIFVEFKQFVVNFAESATYSKSDFRAQVQIVESKYESESFDIVVRDKS